MKCNEIRPVSDITEREVYDFSKHLFSSLMDARKIIEDIQRDVYGREEEEFVFDISSMDIRRILERFNIES